MSINQNIRICRLSLSTHKILISNLDKFWLSKTPHVKPLHHPVFSLLFSDFSFVLFRNLDPVSYIYAAHNRRNGYIHFLATRPEFHRNGFASMLLQHLEEKARDKNLRRLWTYMVPGNEMSEKFFLQHGFIMRKKIYTSSDEIRILFNKAI